MRRLRWTQAVAFGADGIEHASFLVSMASAGSPASPLPVDQLATDGQLAALTASGIPICPSLSGAFEPALFVHMHERVKQIMQDLWSWADWSRRVTPDHRRDDQPTRPTSLGRLPLTSMREGSEDARRSGSERGHGNRAPAFRVQRVIWMACWRGALTRPRRSAHQDVRLCRQSGQAGLGRRAASWW
jgi:hypothetical protein